MTCSFPWTTWKHGDWSGDSEFQPKKRCWFIPGASMEELWYLVIFKQSHFVCIFRLTCVRSRLHFSQSFDKNFPIESNNFWNVHFFLVLRSVVRNELCLYVLYLYIIYRIVVSVGSSRPLQIQPTSNNFHPKTEGFSQSLTGNIATIWGRTLWKQLRRRGTQPTLKHIFAMELKWSIARYAH